MLTTMLDPPPRLEEEEEEGTESDRPRTREERKKREAHKMGRTIVPLERRGNIITERRPHHGAEVTPESKREEDPFDDEIGVNIHVLDEGDFSIDVDFGDWQEPEHVNFPTDDGPNIVSEITPGIQTGDPMELTARLREGRNTPEDREPVDCTPSRNMMEGSTATTNSGLLSNLRNLGTACVFAITGFFSR